MTAAIAWRIGVVLALCVGAWYIVDLIGDKRELTRAVTELTKATKSLTERAKRVEAAQQANDAFDNTTRAQASQGIARNESARRSDPDVQAVDRPYPAGMRHRVFVNADPASGSTDLERDAGAGAGDRDQVPEP